jgi:hypothetical protein
MGGRIRHIHGKPDISSAMQDQAHIGRSAIAEVSREIRLICRSMPRSSIGPRSDDKLPPAKSARMENPAEGVKRS